MKLNDKIYNFSLIWKTINEIFYNKCNLDFDLDLEYKKYLSKIIKTKKDKDYYLLLAKFINRVNDGHTDISFSKEVLDKNGYLPFKLIFVDDNFYAYNTTNELNDITFKKINKINNFNFNSLIKECFNYIHNVNKYCYLERLEKILPFFLKKSNNKLLYDNNKVLTFNLLDNPFKSCLPTLKINHNFIDLSTQNATIFEFNNILYSKIDNFSDNRLINDVVNALINKNYAYSILDLRFNNGGMTKLAGKLASLFIDGEFNYLIKKNRVNNAKILSSASQYKINKDKLTDWINSGLTTKEIINDNLKVLNGDYFEEYIDYMGENNNTKINTKPIVLTNKYTISAGEDFVSMFKCNNKGIIIGENTYGSTGTPYLLRLTDNSLVRICSIYNELLDGTKFINKGIEPDILMKNTIEDYKNDTDNVMNKIIDMINNEEI